MTLALFLYACSVGGDTAKAEDTSSADADTDTDTDTDADADADTGPACSTVNSGDDWAWTGDCPGMTTPVAITVEGCEMTLDYDSVGGMTMGMPYSGTIDGDTVTFADDDKVKGCTGTVDTEDKITGSCKDGCTYKLKR